MTTTIKDDSHANVMKKMLASRVDLKNYVLENAQQNSLQNIIDTIDKFGWTKQWLMNIGDRKGQILDQAVQTRKPKSVLELGTFLGYSSLRIVNQLPKDALFVTIEADSLSAEIARSLHEYAGVGDRIKSFDFIFMDHFGSIYLRDLKMLEELGLITSETMIVADNVIMPGAPDYLAYVRNSPNYTTTLHEENIEYSEDVRDGVEVSIRK